MNLDVKYQTTIHLNLDKASNTADDKIEKKAFELEKNYNVKIVWQGAGPAWDPAVEVLADSIKDLYGYAEEFYAFVKKINGAKINE